jgi:hypothetical protein
MKTKRSVLVCWLCRRARDFLSVEGRLVPYVNWKVN